MSYQKFEKKIKEIGNLKQIIEALSWDEEVMMPEKGSSARSMQKSTLNKLIHDKTLSDELGFLIENIDTENLNENQQANLREIERERERLKDVPSSLIEKISSKRSDSEKAWKQARKEDDFSVLRPELKELLELKREYARKIDGSRDPYEVLFEEHEPYIDYEKAENVLQKVREEITPIVDQIKKSGSAVSSEALSDEFDESAQMELAEEVVEQIGYDKSRGRIDTSEHPFTSGNMFDCRITTRTRKNDLSEVLTAAVHECGHALYNLGLPEEHYATPRGLPRELAIHESQSRLWENHVAKSREFWDFLYPKLEESFPSQFDDNTPEECYEAINQVNDQNLIRISADELTYHIHIIIRFEIERDLVNGEIDVEDIPEIWDDKMEEYLGVRPETDTEGVLQDIHWAIGAFGYFPTYTLGSVISAQLYDEADNEIEGLDQKIAEGEFRPLLEWLRENIHRHGRLYRTDELIEEAMGEKMSSEYFTDYLRNKYGEIYGLEL